MHLSVFKSLSNFGQHGCANRDATDDVIAGSWHVELIKPGPTEYSKGFCVFLCLPSALKHGTFLSDLTSVCQYTGVGSEFDSFRAYAYGPDSPISRPRVTSETHLLLCSPTSIRLSERHIRPLGRSTYRNVLLEEDIRSVWYPLYSLQLTSKFVAPARPPTL